MPDEMRVRTLEEEEIRRRLLAADWGEIGPILLGVAINWAQRYPTLRYAEGGDLALGKACDDIVQDVIVKTLGRQRRWDPERGELLPWLKEVVKSEVDHLAKKKASHREVRIDQDGEDLASRLERIDVVGAFGRKPAGNPERVLARQERVREQYEAVYTLVDGDEELEELVLAIECLIDESKALEEPRRQEIASVLGISVSEVTNRKKRLKRLLLKAKVM